MGSPRTTVLRITIGVLILGISLSGMVNGSTRYEDGSLVLKMQPGHSVDEVVSSVGATVEQQLSQLEIYLLSLPTGPDLDSLAAVVAAMPGVAFCQPNFLVDPLKGVQGSLPVSDNQRTGDFRNQEAATHLGLDQVHVQATGAGVRVAVLDGGVNYNHPLLKDNVVKRRDYVDSDNDPFDEEGGANSGHGTFVAGVTRLVAPEADIYVYRVTGLDGLGNAYVLAEAIIQAVNDGCKVINLSLVTIERHDAIAAAAAYAAEHQVLIVAAAGNGHTPGAHFPASDPNVLGVAAVDTLDLLADFSCYGSNIDVCAPGTGIYGPYLGDSYAWWGGTSFAAPFVAAQAALLWTYKPSATRQEVIDAIISTATSLDHLNPDLAGQLGSGLINPLQSIIMIRGGSLALRVPSEYPTIQAAINASLPGDTVLIAPGEYKENLEIAINRQVLVLGETGAENTILLPASLDLPIISIQYGYNSYGVPEIAGLTITGASGPPAVLIQYSAATIRDNILRDNQIHIDPDFTWQQVSPSTIVILGNDNRRIDIKRNLFINNGGESAIRIPVLAPGSSAYITNNTFWGNDRAITNDEYYSASSEYFDINVYNNIFAHCRYEAIADCESDYRIDLELAHVSHNLFWENGAPWEDHLGYDSSVQIFGDPMLANPALGDARLLPGSAAVDVGDPDSSYNDPDGSRNDVGALWFEALPMPFVHNFEIVSFYTLVPELRWEYVDDQPTTQQMYQIQVGTDSYWDVAEVWDQGPISGSETDIFYSGPPLSSFVIYYFRIRLYNGSQWGDWYEISGRFKGAGSIHVPSDMTSIHDAFDYAVEGDTIFIEPGTYRESVIAECEGLVLMSTGEAASTILQSMPGAEATITVLPGSSQLTIVGLTFTDGSCGILLRDSASCDIRDCRFVGLTGTALNSGFAKSVSSVHCEFVDNNRAVVLLGQYRLDSNYVTGSTLAARLRAGTGSARNNIFARNVQGLQTQSGNVEVVNNTIYGTEGDGLSIGCAGNYYNNLVIFNKGAGIISTYSANVRYNNAYGNQLSNRVGFTEIPGGMSVNPLIVDTAGNTFALRFDSPCMNAGDPDPSHNDPDGSRSDIGAVSGSPVDYPIAANIALEPVNAYGVLKSGTPTITWTYLDPLSTTQNQHEAQLGTDPLWLATPIWTSGPVASGDGNLVYGGPALVDLTTYFLRLRVHDGTEWGDWSSAVVRVSLTGRRRVPDDHATISAAVAAAFDGDSVIVGPGTYRENIDFDGKVVVLTSSDGPDVTIITSTTYWQSALITLNGSRGVSTISNLTFQNPGGQGILLNGAAALVEGCIFTNCGRTPLYVDSTTDQVVVRNNQFLNSCNNGTSGGGIRIANGSALVESNWFNNLGLSGYGGGICLSDTKNCTIKNNLFTNNKANLGGAIRASNSLKLKIHGNTFVGNQTTVQAVYTPGRYGGSCLAFTQSNGNDVDVRNNIFANNGPGWAVLSNVNVACNYNDAYMNADGNYFGVTPGTRSISADPMFADSAHSDFHLTAGSPCIDTGDPAAEFVDADGTRGDIGAFPYQSPQILPVAENINVGDEVQDHVMSLSPTFYWSFKDTVGTQQFYELQLAAFPTTWEGGGIWTTGEVTSVDTLAAYSGPALTRGTNYIARVHVSNGTNWGSWKYLFIHINAGPSTPQFTPAHYPGNRHIEGLSFSGCTDPEKDSVYYDIQFARDSAMENIITQVEHSPSPSLKLNFDGELATVYHWRARATDGYITTPWVQTTHTTCGLGGTVELLAPTGPEFTCGQTVRFVLSIQNDQTKPITAVVNGFTISSPDGATFDPIVVKWALEGPVWDSAYLEGGMTFTSIHHNETVDSVTFVGSIMPLAGYKLPPGAGGIAWYIETQVSCDDIGKEICIDNFDYLPNGSNTWGWYYGDFPGRDWTGHTYPVWGGPYCFTIASCCQGVRGDVNQDGVECTIGDISALIDHLFISCPPLACIDESNLNADPERAITISDITYGVDHLFISQRDLISCTQTVPVPQAKMAAVEPTLWRSVSNDTTSLFLSTDMVLRGVQLSLVGKGTAPARKLTELGLDLVQGRHGDTLKVGLVDLDSSAVIEKGEWVLISVPGEYEVVKAQAADMVHRDVSLAVKDGNPNLPTRFELSQNYPNPFNPVTTIEFALPKANAVKLTIFNILGQTVDVLVDREMPAGYHRVDWNASQYASGVYFYRIKAGEFLETRKMLLLK